MSSARQPEFFFDRSLGKGSARRLRERGLVIHMVAEFYPSDGQNIPDEDWVAEGCRQGWVLLTKDKRIRYRAAELGALQGGFLFCLADGNATLDSMASAFSAAMPAIRSAVSRGAAGFWHVYKDGSIKKMWP